jgi:hypothetical protein
MSGHGVESGLEVLDVDLHDHHSVTKALVLHCTLQVRVWVARQRKNE